MELLKNRSDSGIATFQRSMQRLAAPPERQDTQVSVPVRAHHVTSVTSSTGVQQGDRSHMNVHTNYIVEASELPIVDLLARDPGLVRSLVAALDEQEPGPRTHQFLRAAMRSGGRADDLALLDHAVGLRQVPNTWIFGLFGVDVVDRASAVMVGYGNHLRTGMRVDHAGLRAGTILADLDRIKDEADRIPTPLEQPRSRVSRSDPRGRSCPANAARHRRE